MYVLKFESLCLLQAQKAVSNVYLSKQRSFLTEMANSQDSELVSNSVSVSSQVIDWCLVISSVRDIMNASQIFSVQLCITVYNCYSVTQY